MTQMEAILLRGSETERKKRRVRNKGMEKKRRERKLEAY